MADATMQDLIKQVQLVSDRETRATQDVFNAVGQLNKNVLDFINIQKQGMLDALEARREASNKQASEQSRSESSKRDSGGGFMIPGLAGFAIPALVGLVASLTEADQLLRAFALPKIFKGLVRVVTGIADGVRDALRFVSSFPGRITRAFNAIVDIFPKIRFDPLKLNDGLQSLLTRLLYFFESLKNPIVSISKFFDDVYKGIIRNIRGAIISVTMLGGLVMDSIDNFFKGIGGNVSRIYNNFITFIDRTFARIGKVFSGGKLLEAVTGIYNGIVERVTRFFDPIKNILGAFTIEMPSWMKDFKIPGLATLKSFFVGAEAGGGIMGFFSGLLDFAKPILAPLKLVGRHIFGPISQVIMGLIDFFVGFYEGFVGNPEYDEDGNLMGDSRGLMEKIGDGLIGGVKGLIKGITEAIDLLLVGIPAWIAGKLGFTEFSENLNKFWDEGGLLTKYVDPFIDFLVKIPDMIIDLIPSMDDIKKAFSELTEQFSVSNLLGGLSNTRLGRLFGGGDEEKKLKELEAQKDAAQAEAEAIANKGVGADGKRLKELTEKEKQRLAELDRQKLEAMDQANKLKQELGKSNMAGTADLDPRVVSYRKLQEAQNERDEAQANADKRGYGMNMVDASNKTNVNNNSSTTIATGAPPSPRDTTDRAIAVGG